MGTVDDTDDLARSPVWKDPSCCSHCTVDKSIDEQSRLSSWHAGNVLGCPENDLNSCAVKFPTLMQHLCNIVCCGTQKADHRSATCQLAL